MATRYVNKMVFVEIEEVKNFDLFKSKGVIQDVDYGNTELTADQWQNFKTERYENANMIDISDEEIKVFTECVGTDIIEMLEKDELDFIQFIYE